MKKIWNAIKFVGGIYLILTLFALVYAASIDTPEVNNATNENVVALYETPQVDTKVQPQPSKKSHKTTKRKSAKGGKKRVNTETTGLVSGTCNGTTKKGYPCRNRVKAGEYYCWRHK